ncbi:phospholipase D-like domain-containing protein [Streptomonospora algeriensis]|uniref:Phospholipase D-like domain-containing protein n=1 Tax=Streptomonospora algeriensis TaxID=995084 RepID=A0ABW3B9Q5_9ACTN
MHHPADAKGLPPTAREAALAAVLTFPVVPRPCAGRCGATPHLAESSSGQVGVCVRDSARLVSRTRLLGRHRGVEVRVVTLPRWELSHAMRRFHDELVRRIRYVVFMADQHQKIVVIDGQTTFIGSMDLLSRNRYAGRRESMTIVESAAYAQHILSFERVDQLRMPPRCSVCNNRMRVVKLTNAKSKPVLKWQCRAGGGRGDLCWETEFPPLAGTRNQPAPAR